MSRLADLLQHAVSRREHTALCTVVATSGSTPLKPGARMLVWRDGTSQGTIGGGRVEKQVTEDAAGLISKGSARPRLATYKLPELDMCCGGTMQVFIEPLLPRNQLVLFGAGHVGNHLAMFAHRLDFGVVIADERGDVLAGAGTDKTVRLHGHHLEMFRNIHFDERTYIVICTHRHDYDRELLALCLGRPHAYLGMIGSRRKALVTAKRFRQQGVAGTAEISRVDMPAGYDLGSNSPAGIALGIMAKIEAVSNGMLTDDAGSVPGLVSFCSPVSDNGYT